MASSYYFNNNPNNMAQNEASLRIGRIVGSSADRCIKDIRALFDDVEGEFQRQINNMHQMLDNTQDRMRSRSESAADLLRLMSANVSSREMQKARGRFPPGMKKIADEYARFFVVFPSICPFMNHTSGTGCKRHSESGDCTYTHQCIMCGSASHGAFYRTTRGQYICEKHADIIPFVGESQREV